MREKLSDDIDGVLECLLISSVLNIRPVVMIKLQTLDFGLDV